MLIVFFTQTVFMLVLMLVLMLEVQKGCNGDVDTCILDNFSYPNYSLIQTPWHNLQTKGVQITEDVQLDSSDNWLSGFGCNGVTCNGLTGCNGDVQIIVQITGYPWLSMDNH